jgi:CDP-glucose 4,6-dehydratase
VLLTGHTGFKGAWASVWLKQLGAKVCGFALAPEGDPNLWSELGPHLVDEEIIGDLRDESAVAEAVARSRPELVLHMAAQSLVRESYRRPVMTFATNIMGSVHLLQALRDSGDVRAALIVTTDKVYANNENGRHFVEDDPLGGHDPYSASKAAAEIVTACFANAFFEDGRVRVATARAGNVIGGGDWSAERIVPDVWRAASKGEQLVLRNPEATRPWQHVLEPLAGYFLYIEALANGIEVPPALNFGPTLSDNPTVSQVADAVGQALGLLRAWQRAEKAGPREMQSLSLDPTRAQRSLGWRTRLKAAEAIRWTADWYAARDRGVAPIDLCLSQIDRYENLL